MPATDDRRAYVVTVRLELMADDEERAAEIAWSAVGDLPKADDSITAVTVEEVNY